MPIEARLVREKVETIEPTLRAFVTSGSNQFSFLVPHGYRFQGDPASGRLTLINREGNRSITFCIIGAPPPGTYEAMAEASRNLLLSRHPSAKILQQFVHHAAGATGPGFDLEWKAFGETFQRQRVVLLPTPAGLLELTATSSREGFPDNQASLNLLFSTLSYSTNGRLKVVDPSPNS